MSGQDWYLDDDFIIGFRHLPNFVEEFQEEIKNEKLENLGIESLEEKRAEELEKIKSNISQVRLSGRYYFDQKAMILVGEELLVDKSILESNHLLQPDIFREVNPTWKVYLMKSAYKIIEEIPNLEHIMFIIQDFMMGRFKITEEGKNFIKIRPIIENNYDIYGMIVYELYPEKGLKIIIYFQEENCEKKSFQFSCVYQELFLFR